MRWTCGKCTLVSMYMFDASLSRRNAVTNCDAIRLLVLGEDLILHQLQTLSPNSSAMRIREIIEVKDGSCAEYRRSFLSHQKVL